jgi:uncharacterized membrane protein YqjE
MTERSAASSGLLHSLRRLVATLLAIGEARLELLSTELEEEFARIASLLLVACLALFFVGLGVVFAAFFIVIYFWDDNRLLAVGLLTAFFVIGAAIAGNTLRKQLNERPRFFAASIDELRKDREHVEEHR